MGRLLKAALAFYVYGNFHVSLCAAAWSDVTCMIMGFRVESWLALFSFCATFCLYNVQRVYASWKLSKIERQHTVRHEWIKQNRLLMTVLMLAALIAGGIIFISRAFVHDAGAGGYRFEITDATREFYGWCISASFIAVAYALPLIPGRGRWKRLRDLPGVKIFLIALVWAVVCGMWPLCGLQDLECFTGWPEQLDYMPLKNYSALIFSIYTAFAFAITVPFDVRDFLIDGATVKSLPVLLGIKRSLRVAVIVLLLIAAACVYFAFPQNQFTWGLLAFGAACIPTAIVVSKATPRRHEYYFSLLTDGTLLLVWAAVYLTYKFMW
ncbi:MAG: hypothetical protein MUC87_03380 [Bacteroidia bacterium]|jgi:hypothetical protein|nr:hypothetical protein [Bacteroidia bacterium]